MKQLIKERFFLIWILNSENLILININNKAELISVKILI